MDIWLTVEDDREDGFLIELEATAEPATLRRELRSLVDRVMDCYDRQIAGSPLGIRKNPDEGDRHMLSGEPWIG